MSEESKMLPKSMEAVPTLKGIAPCLHSRSENSQRREPRKVSFPEEESELVTGYLEPANPWEYAENVSRDDLISTYTASCEKHGTCPLPHVLDQLKILDVDAVRNECLDLKGSTLESTHCETLEEVLKRVQFKNINLEATSLDDEGSVALFDMVEYYESATHLNISSNKNIGVRGWQACSRMIKKTRCLEQLEARNVTLNEQFMPILSRALRIGTQLQVLKLENSNLSGRPTIILAAALKLNAGLRELYLADNNLGVTDAIQLGVLLRNNFTLQLLDISNNNIQDAGLGHISDGLTNQTPGQSGNGLGILVLWNNHLTRNASKHFARAVARSQTLETLNIGQNLLTNECLHVMKDSLQQNRTLLRLGMQSTHLTCEGAIALAECIADNPVIQRIDLRENNLKVAGLMALSLSMKVNMSVTQLDLDNAPKKKTDEDNNTTDQYQNLVSEIREYCTRNEAAAREEEDTVDEGPTTETPGKGRVSNNTSRKISLTCETLLRTTAMPPQPIIQDSGLLTEPRRGSGGRLRSPAPSPIPSPVSSPVPSPSRTRFQVSRVTELSPFINTGHSGSPTSTSSSPITPPSLSSSPSRFFPSPTTSRFRVTLVESSAPPPTVTSPSGNVTVGFDFKKGGTDSLNQPTPKASSSAPQIQVVNGSKAEKTPEIVVTSSSVTSQSFPPMTQQAPVSQNVKVTVKLDPSSDTLIIENESSPSVASDTTEDTADMEVRSIMDPGSLEDNTWASCNVQDSVTLLRRAGKCMPITPEKETQTCFPFPDISDKDTSLLQTEKVGSAEDLVKQNSVASPSSSVISDEQVDNNLKLLTGLSDSNSKQTEQIENTVRQSPASLPPVSPPQAPAPAAPPQRSRKISWIASAEPDEHRVTSSLEKLLGLFHNPGSFFNKTQQQYKATAAIVNPQPVANSNASFLLTAGPLGNIANGGNDILSGSSRSDTDLFKDSAPLHAAKEVKTALKQSPGVSRKEQKTLNSENPIPDIINNNNKVQEVTILRSCDVGGNGSSGRVGKETDEYNRRRCEDENYNVSKSYEDVIKTNLSKSNGTKSVSQQTVNPVTCRSFHPAAEVGVVAELKGTSTKNCDSICNLTSKHTDENSQSTDTIDKDDIGTDLESLKLVDSLAALVDKQQLAGEENISELKVESNAIKNSPTNGINFKSIPCRTDLRRDVEQFSVDLANGSPANSELTWSRNCESSLVTVQSAATVRLVGGASGFTSYELPPLEMESQREDGATSLLLSGHSVDSSKQPAGKELEMLQNLELSPSNAM